MDESGQRTPVNHQPRDESTELFGGEEVYLEHADGVRANGAVPDGVDAEFGDCSYQYQESRE